ncbi:MAG: hypothetical protein EXR72_20830 [Myxococcales bacterium]|nr:hypothetical protein [Myxococcales bacterium]
MGCFNRLYRGVTEGVAAGLASGFFVDGPFVERLDVVFANLYLGALERFESGARAETPSAWRPLFEARTRKGILPLQFALAGMNAHINRDLAVALVTVCEERGVSPDRESAAYDDFVRLNQKLAEPEEGAKRVLATGAIAEVDEALGPADDLLAMWSVARARDAAWTSAEAMWALKGLPFLAEAWLGSHDRMVGFASRALLRLRT